MLGNQHEMLGKMMSSENEILDKMLSSEIKMLGNYHEMLGYQHEMLGKMLSSENEMLDKMLDKNTRGNGGQRLLDCKTKIPHHPQLLKHPPPISPLPRSLSIYLIHLFHGAKLWFTSFCTAEALIKVNVIFFQQFVLIDSIRQIIHILLIIRLLDLGRGGIQRWGGDIVSLSYSPCHVAMVIYFNKHQLLLKKNIDFK